MSESFVDKLTAAIDRNNSLLCVGLDPDPARISADFMPGDPDVERIKQFCLDIIAQTSDLVCCYKPNFAFFEQFGPAGLEALRQVITAIPGDLPVLLDAKRGDIGNTAQAYARAAFEVWGADAITLNPYLGKDSITPFIAYEGKTAFLLCHTSNPSASQIQHHGLEPLYLEIARQAQSWGASEQIAFVVGATQPDALAAVRQVAPHSWILAPGVGAQGGDLAATLTAGLDDRGIGMIVPVSRGVLYADDPRQAAQILRDQIMAHRGVQPVPKPHVALIRGLFEAGCVKFGSFTLASGKQSPVYIDLRRVISYPALFRRVVDAYIALSRPLNYDRIAAVPYAALPTAAAMALQLGEPLIYPRKEVKAYGTGQAVEGAFEAGQIALAIEDV
ncbi:MAG: orotidine-5'-phosphate decarboxylase, partial [Anaerolineae bacterium]|nr:orotidine-5'-phosphate decarboxylase [Anaerolineae bacterium]